MADLKLLLASDLHYCRLLQTEIDATVGRLPADTYDHMREGRLFWHNEMLVEHMARMLQALIRLSHRLKPDRIIFMGDLVNTNWSANVMDVVRGLNDFACPLHLITGNHDIYLGDPPSRLQDRFSPGQYATGIRHQFIDDLGLIFLDVFVHYPDREYAKEFDIHRHVTTLDYRPSDIDMALELMDSRPDCRFLVFGHFPMCDPEDRVYRQGRRIGTGSPCAKPLSQRLHQANNLLGIVAGHQHFAHLQRFRHGFHWTLPSLVEYPSSAAILKFDHVQISGRLIAPDEELALRSLQRLNQRWPAGQSQDKEFCFPFSKPAL